MIVISDIPDLKIVFEAKKKDISLTQKFYDDEIKGALENRGASKAILVVHPDHNPGKSPFFFWEDAIVAVYDPESGDDTALSVAYQLARKIAVESLVKGDEGIDLSKFKNKLSIVMAYVDHISKIEGGITNSVNSLEKVKKDVQDTKDKLKESLKDLMSDLESEEEE